MAEQRKARIIDPADGKTYEVTLDEDSRTLLTSASTGVVKIKDAILANGNNSYTNAEAEALGLEISDLIQAEGLYA